MARRGGYAQAHRQERRVKPSIPERAAQLAKLADYFAGRGDGEELGWLRIEHDAGVMMDLPGRALARRALARLKRPYEAVRGEGVRLSAPSNSMTILRGKFVKIDRAVRRADRTRSQIADRHMAQLAPADQQRMLVLAGFFGAVRAFAKEAEVKVIR